MSGTKLFASAGRAVFDLQGAQLVTRTVGRGSPMLFVHGFPTHGFTWRGLLPVLSQHFTCILVDLPGLGESIWDGRADLSFTAQAARLAELCDRLDLDDLTIVAHDTGASLARLVALAQPERVARLVLINTEVPGHRPPWIELFQKVSRLAGATRTFQWLLGRRWFVRSSLGLRAFYTDKALLDRPEMLSAYVRPLVASRAAAEGALAYLRGIEWRVVDGFRTRHRDIAAEVLLLWGEDDVTFPVEHGRAMTAQFARASFVPIAGTSLLPHEEKPELVAAEILRFVQG